MRDGHSVRFEQVVGRHFVGDAVRHDDLRFSLAPRVEGQDLSVHLDVDVPGGTPPRQASHPGDPPPDHPLDPGREPRLLVHETSRLIGPIEEGHGRRPKNIVWITGATSGIGEALAGTARGRTPRSSASRDGRIPTSRPCTSTSRTWRRGTRSAHTSPNGSRPSAASARCSSTTRCTTGAAGTWVKAITRPT